MPARHADREAARLIRHRHIAPDVGPSGSYINCNATPIVGLIVSATLEHLTLDFRLRWDFSKTQEQLGMCRLCEFLQRSVGGEGVLRPRTLAPDFFARQKLCNRLVAFDSV